MKLLRRVLPFLAIAIVAGALYDAWIFYSRWSGNRAVERANRETEAAQKRRQIDALGGDKLKILSFYAAPGAIRRGASASLCYGVNGAKTVRLEPAVAEVWPALSRCLQVSPRRETEYKLIAEDAAGHTATESVVLKVHS
jgi:hypothetical protein